MKTVHDSMVRKDLLRRVKRLGPDASGSWGSMTPPVVLFHLNAGMKLALGDVVAEPVGDPRFWHTKGKSIALGEDPWPESAPSMPEALPGGESVDLEREREQFAVLLERIAAKDLKDDWPAHPRLGPFTGEEWSRFTYTHVQHHFRQFGI